MPLDEALLSLATRTGLHDMRMLVATLGIARDLGGGLAEVLERLGESVRRRVAMEDRIEALTAQGRMQGAIVGALPLLVALALYAMEPASMSRLFTTAIGWLVVGVVATLELAGWALIRKVVRIDV
jgi:tight adherence protein B